MVSLQLVLSLTVCILNSTKADAMKFYKQNFLFNLLSSSLVITNFVFWFSTFQIMRIFELNYGTRRMLWMANNSEWLKSIVDKMERARPLPRLCDGGGCCRQEPRCYNFCFFPTNVHILFVKNNFLSIAFLAHIHNEYIRYVLVLKFELL